MGTSGDEQTPRLADLVRQLRRRAGLTQQETADLAGLSVAGLRDLEQGRVSSPRPATLRRLAAALTLAEGEADQLLRATRPKRSGVRIQVLGPLTVSIDSEPVDTRSVPQRILLGLLALSPGTSVPRDELVDAAWGAEPPPNAANLLQTHMSRLRRRLQSRTGRDDGPRPLVGTTGGYQLLVDDDQLDLLTFRKAADQARQTRATGNLAEACDHYQRATSLWRDEPLADLPTLHTHPRVYALVREYQAAVLEHATIATAIGRHQQVLPQLQRLTEAAPLHEAAHAHLMIALAGSGHQAAALDVFDKLRRRLAEELGADPGHELADAHQRILRQEITRPETTPVSARRQLPPDIVEFTGRATELAALREQLPREDDQSTALIITNIQGMAGVGKTRLAVHLAHQLVAEGRYPDVQLYVDLHGHAKQPPADPAAVLASFLYLLGVPGSQVPKDPQARAALFRDQLHEKRAIVVLDNAADEEQVRPLLPASPTNLVIITSRRTLALDGATTLPLDVLPPREAADLLGRIAGTTRVTSDPESTRRVVELCGRLPLAVALAARRLQSRPRWRVANLAARLEEKGARLDEFSAGSRKLRAVFDLSYQALPDELASLFRLLGHHPGDDFTATSAAALAGRSPDTVRELLDQLADEHLLTMSSADRYRLHDLLREYAAEQAERYEGVDTVDEAVGRLLEWYLHATDTAGRMLFPYLMDVRLDESDRPRHIPVFRTEEHAFRWLTAEHTTLLAATALAVERGIYRIAWQLPAALKHYLERRSTFDDWINVSELALTAARRAGNQSGEASALNLLGLAYGQLSHHDTSVEYLTRALEIRGALGDDESRRSEARLLNNLGVAYCHLKRHDESLDHLEEALDLSRKVEDRYLETRVLSNLGWVHTRLDQHSAALDALLETLDIARRSNDPVGMVTALHNLGEACLRAGRHHDTISYLRRALAIYQHKHFRLHEAEALKMLGDALLATRQREDALTCWKRSLTILDQVGHKTADDVRARIDVHSTTT